MERNSSINVRVEADIKEQAEAIFDELGLSTATAINSFLRQVVMRQGMPFPMNVVKKPKSLEDMTSDELNAELAKGLKSIALGRTYSDAEVEAMFQGRMHA